MIDSLWLHVPRHVRLPWPSLSLGVCSNSCPSSWCCQPIISSSVTSFTSCPQSFPTSGSFPVSRLFTSGGQSIGASASASVLPMNIQWFPLGLVGLIFLLFTGLSRVFSCTAVLKHQFFGAQPFYSPTFSSVHNYWKNHSFDYLNFCWQNDGSAF